MLFQAGPCPHNLTKLNKNDPLDLPSQARKRHANILNGRNRRDQARTVKESIVVQRPREGGMAVNDVPSGCTRVP